MRKPVPANRVSVLACAIAASMLVCASGRAVAQSAFAAPATRVAPETETIHGVAIVDPYRWLEGDNSDPARMGAMTEEVAAWTDAQNAATRALLDSFPGRAALEETLRPLLQIGSVSAPTMRGNRYFYTKREGTERQPRVFVREGASGTPRVLLDPTQIDPTGLTALGGLAPSDDGTLLGFGLFRAGDENTTVYVMDVATGAWLPTTIEGKASIVQWLPDNSGFFYERLADVNNPYSAQIRLHRLGTNPKGDPLLFRQYLPEEDAKLATTWGPGATVSRDGRWMVLFYWTGTSSNDAWVIDLDRWRQTGEFVKSEIKVGAPNNFFGTIEGSTFYMLTDFGAPKKRLVAVDLNNPGESAWREIVAERADAVLSSFSVASGILALEYEEKASTRVRLHGLDGSPKGDLALPGIGSASLSTRHDRTEAFLSFTSFNYPSTVFRVDLAQPEAKPVVWERPEVPVDPETVEVTQVTYSSKDGTPVTMFLVHKKGLVLNGDNPTLLTGYGGFGISETPFFSATLFPWFEAGGVFAMPNLRGGGEYGKEWHEGGMRERKQNVFDDFHAAAQWLIDNRYTSPNRLAISGGSNGGLLTGAAVTQRPDLFRAVIIDVPLLDMLRYQHFLMARYWVPEYGGVDEPEVGARAFEWLRAYSPYHNIKAGTAYPAVFLTAGENDTRVHPMHARKMAAALQAATTSDPAEKPVILWVDRDAGHGAGKPLNLRLRDLVDKRIFLMWQLGMLDAEGKPKAAPAAGAMAAPVDGAASGGGEGARIVAARQVTLGVKGMSCELCADSVKDTLEKIAGVTGADVSVEKGEAVVSVAPGSTPDVAALVKAFEGSKYTVTAR
jgi:prolyl oligopeptidase